MDTKDGIWKFFKRRREPTAVKQVDENTVDISKQAPNLDFYVWRPILSEPPLCSLKELSDGTYTINDLADMHEALNLKRRLYDS